METTEKTRKGGIGAAILIVLLTIGFMLPYLSPAMMMADMMESFQCGYSYAGLTISIIMAMGGVCMFICSFVQDRIGIWNTIILAIILGVIGNIISAVAPGMVIFMVGRAIIGAGYGFASNCTNPLINYWFKGKAQTYMITIFTVSSSVGMALAYKIVAPLEILTGGSWQMVFMVFAVGTIVLAIVWIIFGKVYDAPGIPERKPVEAVQKKAALGQSSLVRALHYKQFWLLMIIATLTTTVSTINGSYMPTILTTERGFTEGLASSVSSIGSAAGIIGTAVGGVLIAQTGRRKPVYLGLTGAAFVALMAYLFAPNAALVMMFGALYGALGMAILPAQSTLVMETQPDYTILSGAFALVCGVGLLFNLVVPSIFVNVSGAAGSMTAGYRILAFLLIAAVILILFIKETGKKAAEQAVKAQEVQE